MNKKYQLFLIDLDGTMYRGTEKIEEAPQFIKQIEAEGIDYIFLTNNSSKTPDEVAHHLQLFGIEADASDIYTTSMGTAHYIKQQKKNARIYMIGGNGLRTALAEAGCVFVEEEAILATCDYVVIGLDRDITYEKLAKAALAVRAGATFISTNADKALPTERGLLPGNGSLTSVISTATGVAPIFIGKPEPLMINLLIEQKGLSREEVLMIGDNYDTDIMAGIGAHVDTALVFTGFTSKQDLSKYIHVPTYQWQNLLEWNGKVNKEKHFV